MKIKIGWIILLSIFLGLGYYYYNDYLDFIKNTEITISNLEVNKGDNAQTITEKLCKKNVVNECIYLKIYNHIDKPNNIKVGIYNFSGVNLEAFYKQLSKGPKIKYEKITILPGRTKFDIKSYLEKKTNKDISEKFLALIDNKNYINNNFQNKLKGFGDISSLEGFIYPDTYFFKQSDLKSILFPELLIKTSVNNFIKKWNKLQKECKQNCNPYKLSNYEIIILASIVEKEEKNTKNMADIADILTRRYKNKWFIGADWTLCYGLKVNSKECKNYLYNKYLKDKNNKYNTRVNLGLPPTPVGNPTINSIKSVLFPKKNNNWYYLHGNDGKIHYGRNENEHIMNKNMYLR